MRKGLWSRGLLLFFAIVLSTIFLTSAQATEPQRSLTFGLWTQHFQGDHTEGIDNHLIVVEYDGIVLAGFRNSYGKETVFIGGGFHTKKWTFRKKWWIRGNVYAGAMLGYGDEHPVHLGPLSPGVFPTASLGYDRYALEATVLPTFWWVGLKVEF